ncbi:RagB/SusD family nutrient uptake outer membrane protein [Echinicola salinicaeni]|uniref:RagB/SusD family nutrient uptake outer membrane protein n=1 Tax=Echinicola salinicaeni TaxID=2762757 RepID=UPI001644AB18|nr:RagB/SusD family nutrient uptake outer membrane protein [Echinicola salinicaeni]
MKRIKKYTLIILSMTLMAGCEGFLDKNPTDQLSSSLFWKSKSDFDNALTAIYGTIQNSMYSFGAPNLDVLTDNGYGQHNYWGSREIVQGNINPTSGGYVSNIYSSSYQAIARVNIFLDQLSNYMGTDISPEQIGVYEGEAKFFRAYFYFELYKAYGSVPVVTAPLNLENQHQEKQPESAVLAQITADLNEAIGKLSAVPFSDGAGHVVKSSAEGLLLRVLMYDAYDENGNAKMDVLQDAKSLATSLMGAGYGLADEYVNVFKDGTQEGNKEIIFSIKFLAPDNATSMDQWYGDWFVISPLQNFVDDYECIDGLPYGESPLTDTEQPFNNRDSRLTKTVFKDIVDWGDGNTHTPSNGGPTTFGLKKFLTPSLIPYGYSTRSQQDWVLLRYADVLLMYAELENELSGPNADVYDAINEVRLRSDMPALPAGLSKEEMRERIRHERRIELAFEGLRLYDLKRWRIAEDVLNNVEDGIVGYHYEDKFFHWPIPQSEIDKSNGILEQNPDYQ